MDLHTDRPHPARVYNYLLGGSVYGGVALK
jgi:hypothetical protein